MKILNGPEIDILTPISRNGEAELRLIEKAARVCYKSEERITNGSAERLIKNLILRGHTAPLEHSTLTVKFICDRGVANELVRHRLASYCQESTRYCNYSKDQFDSEITVIKPILIEPGSTSYNVWKMSCETAENAYFSLLDIGETPQNARSVLPLSLKTEIVVTANYREWMHILNLRTSEAAHPDIRFMMHKLLIELRKDIPVIFDDVGKETFGVA